MQYRLYLQIGAVAVLAASAAAASAVIGLRRRPDPAEREKRRRLDVNIAGRLADGSIIDVTESTVYYLFSPRRRLHGGPGRGARSRADRLRPRQADRAGVGQVSSG